MPVAVSGSDARWFDVSAIPAPHPALRLELRDAGIWTGDPADIAEALREAGIEMTALP